MATPAPPRLTTIHRIPPPPQVGHRCPCTDASQCGELEAKVKQLAKDGKLPPFPVEGRSVDPDKLGVETWPSGSS